MRVKEIEANALRQMQDREGLVLQGCGGDLQEWIDGINGMLTVEDILLDGTAFKAENCIAFSHNNVTNLLLPFTEDVKLNMGKLAMWRLQTHEAFGGTWLSDYVPNRLGGFAETVAGQSEEKQKPDCPLIGADGNIFNLMGIAAKTLRQNGMQEEATEMCSRIRESGSYHSALGIIGEYVHITSVDDMDEDCGQEEGIYMQ